MSESHETVRPRDGEESMFRLPPRVGMPWESTVDQCRAEGTSLEISSLRTFHRTRSPQYGLNDTIQTFITQAHEVLPYNSVYVINRQSGPGQSKQKLTSMLGLAVVLENQDLVEMLLNSAAEVHPDIGTVPPLMRAVLSEHKGNVQLSWVGHRRMVWKGYRPRVRLVLAGGHASAWLSPFWRGPAPGAQREPKGTKRAIYRGVPN